MQMSGIVFEYKLSMNHNQWQGRLIIERSRAGETNMDKWAYRH